MAGKNNAINAATPFVVSKGGTGATTLTSHGLLYGNGTSAVGALSAATDGQIPIGSTGNAPTVTTITAGTGISVTNGSGSITIASTGSGLNEAQVMGRIFVFGG